MAEYQSLRQEILQNQQVRIFVLALVLTVFGTVTGFVLGRRDSGDDIFVPGLVAFLLLLIAVAGNLTTVLTQRIDMLSGYIRRYIESQYEDGLWETRWTARRKELKRTGRAQELPLGTSKPLAYAYAAVIVGAVAMYFLAAGLEDFWRFPIILPTLAGAVWVVYDLYRRRSKRWINPFDDPLPPLPTVDAGGEHSEAAGSAGESRPPDAKTRIARS